MVPIWAQDNRPCLRLSLDACGLAKEAKLPRQILEGRANEATRVADVTPFSHSKTDESNPRCRLLDQACDLIGHGYGNHVTPFEQMPGCIG